MHYCTFVIIGPQGDPDALVAGTLAPFDEALAVPPYREYLQPFDIERMASHYTLDQRDLDALAQRMKDWTGRPGGVDERGLYFTTTNNPQGRWDWFEIGGRWNGLLKRASRNVISTRALRKSLDLKDLLPNADYRPQQRGKIRNESEIRNPNVQKTHASTCRHAGTIGRPVLF